MNEWPGEGDDSLGGVDRRCDAFEDAWQAGQRPRIEDFLEAIEGKERQALLRELIQLDVEYRRCCGEVPHAEDYARHFVPQVPRWLAEIVARTPSGGNSPASGLRGVPSASNATKDYVPAQPAAERFAPGTLLAARRYRVVALLGKGAMGEVYRADDLVLGQPVALKFLPEHLATDPDRLARLRQEVADARRISHANVCRVYDIGEHDGLPFLTMEYIDGEDLASLLRRVGRLPEETAVEIARQLCAALAAVHEKGLLHRDLKPANVMLDGRGKVRLTDFGLAATPENLSSTELRAGTPAYQSPEQLRGEAVGVPSDLFALGLTLYELFTGKKAFPANTREELLKRYDSGPPSKPSTVIPGLGAAAEQIILCCLERDPQRRPCSAYEVQAALPGGDPLPAALAAGQTPSPQMVADAGGEGRLPLATALTCLTAVVAGVVACVLFLQQAKLIARVSLPLRPEVLDYKAREILAQLGHGPLPYHTYGFEHDGSYLHWVEENDRSSARWDALRESRSPVLSFWYRQSRSPLVPNLYFPEPGAVDTGRITRQNPPLNREGMATVKLDMEGRLIGFWAVPSDKAESGEESWEPLFKAAGLQHADFRPGVEPTRIPPVAYNRRESWAGSWPDRPDVLMYIEAASYRGQPVYFQIVGPWTPPDEAEAPFSVATEARHVGSAIVFALLLGAAGVLVPWNLRRGRADLQGASHLAVFVFAMFVLAWLFKNQHVWGVAEVDMLVMELACALYWAGLCWLSYVALEPFARRLWPESLISWRRLLAGRVRDPRVGRDILIGTLAGVGWFASIALARLVPGWLGQAAPVPSWDFWVPDTFVTGYWAENILDTFPYAVRNGLFFWLLLLVLPRVIFRKPWLAAGVYVVVLTAVTGPLNGLPPVSYLFIACAHGLGVAVLTRCGVLAVITMMAVGYLLDFPITSDLEAWYVRQGLLTVGLILALAGYGFWTSLGGRAPAWEH